MWPTNSCGVPLQGRTLVPGRRQPGGTKPRAHIPYNSPGEAVFREPINALRCPGPCRRKGSTKASGRGRGRAAGGEAEAEGKRQDSGPGSGSEDPQREGSRGSLEAAARTSPSSRLCARRPRSPSLPLHRQSVARLTREKVQSNQCLQLLWAYLLRHRGTLQNPQQAPVKDTGPSKRAGSAKDSQLTPAAEEGAEARGGNRLPAAGSYHRTACQGRGGAHLPPTGSQLSRSRAPPPGPLQEKVPL